MVYYNVLIAIINIILLKNNINDSTTKKLGLLHNQIECIFNFKFLIEY